MTIRIRTALMLAADNHKGDIDRSGIEKMHHVLSVWRNVWDKDEDTQVVALLHDLVEDTNVKLEYIQFQFGPTVRDAVELLTHVREVPYDVYIRNLAPNRIARTVKLADLKHNTSRERLEGLSLADYAYHINRRREKYAPAIEFLCKYEQDEVNQEIDRIARCIP